MTATLNSMLSTSRERESELRLIHLLVEKIEPDPAQPRKYWDAGQITELAASLRQDGVLHPILVMPADDRGMYQIIAGERRWRAAKEGGLRRIPGFVLKRDEIGRRRVQLVENLQRVDLTASERAQHVAMMRELLELQAQADGRTLGERDLDGQVGEMLGLSDRAVRDFLAAVALPIAVQDVARENDLSIKHLRAAKLVGEERAVAFITAAAMAKATGDETLTAARLVRDRAMPVEQAVQQARPLSTNADPDGLASNSGSNGGADAAERGDQPVRLRPVEPLPSMPRQRRTMYVRLLDMERMLGRLPLLEATDQEEARLWIKALDRVAAKATALRRSLAAMGGSDEKGSERTDE